MLFAAGQTQAAVLSPARGLTGLLFEAVVEFDTVLQELGDAGRASQLSDEAGSVERGAAGQLAALEDDHIGPAMLRQVVGDATTDDAAADDDDPGVLREWTAHELLPTDLIGSSRYLRFLFCRDEPTFPLGGGPQDRIGVDGPGDMLAEL